MVAAMTLSETEIQLAFRDLEPALFQLMLSVREQLLSYMPEHNELLKWGSIAFDKPGAKATVKDNICYLRPRKRVLEIGFGLGVFLSDPKHLLRGDGRYKRQVILKGMGDYHHDAVKELVLQAYDFDTKRVLYKLLPNDDYQTLRKGI